MWDNNESECFKVQVFLCQDILDVTLWLETAPELRCFVRVEVLMAELIFSENVVLCENHSP